MEQGAAGLRGTLRRDGRDVPLGERHGSGWTWGRRKQRRGFLEVNECWKTWLGCVRAFDVLGENGRSRSGWGGWSLKVLGCHLGNLLLYTM